MLTTITVFFLSLFCILLGAFTGEFLYVYKKNKSDLGVLIFYFILSLLIFIVIIWGVINFSTILKKLLLIIPISVYFYAFFSVQKKDSSLINSVNYLKKFFTYVEDFSSRFFSKIGFWFIILTIIFLLLFFIIKLIKFIWFY
jgi:hypothetical protein